MLNQAIDSLGTAVADGDGECGRDARQGGYGEWKISERRRLRPGRDALDIEAVAINGPMASHGQAVRAAAKNQWNSGAAEPDQEKSRATDKLGQ